MSKPTFVVLRFLRLRCLGKGSVDTCECDVKQLTDQRTAAQPAAPRGFWRRLFGRS
jgi:hypothetical protein